MELVNLVKIRKGQIETYKLLDKTPKQVQEDHDLHTRWYLLVSINNTEEVYIDISLVFVETNLNHLVTWEDIKNNLTDRILEAYSTTLPTNTKKNVITTHLLNTDDFELSYCNITTPEDRNIKTFRWRMPDLVVTKINEKNTTNFNNCLCCINGIISIPYVYKNELFIKDGARYMSSTTELNWPSVLLIDFSEIGDIEIVPFKDCSTKYYTDHNVKDSYCDIKLYLPDGKSLKNKTIFPVVAHSLFFPENIIISSQNSIVLSPHKLPIRTSLLKTYQHSEKFIENTDIIKTNSTIEKYITEEMFTTDWYGNFFVIVNNPRIFITSVYTTVYASSTHSTIPNNGILFDKSTQSFLDYTKVEYDSLTDLYTNRCSNNFEFDLPFNYYNTSVLNWDCTHREDLFNIYKRDYRILNIFGE